MLKGPQGTNVTSQSSQDLFLSYLFLLLLFLVSYSNHPLPFFGFFYQLHVFLPPHISPANLFKNTFSLSFHPPHCSSDRYCGCYCVAFQPVISSPSVTAITSLRASDNSRSATAVMPSEKERLQLLAKVEI